jgi:hypothetical protein
LGVSAPAEIRFTGEDRPDRHNHQGDLPGQTIPENNVILTRKGKARWLSLFGSCSSFFGFQLHIFVGHVRVQQTAIALQDEGERAVVEIDGIVVVQLNQVIFDSFDNA